MRMSNRSEKPLSIEALDEIEYQRLLRDAEDTLHPRDLLHLCARVLRREAINEGNKALAFRNEGKTIQAEMSSKLAGAYSRTVGHQDRVVKRLEESLKTAKKIGSR